MVKVSQRVVYCPVCDEKHFVIVTREDYKISLVCNNPDCRADFEGDISSTNAWAFRKDSTREERERESILQMNAIETQSLPTIKIISGGVKARIGRNYNAETLKMVITSPYYLRQLAAEIEAFVEKFWISECGEDWASCVDNPRLYVAEFFSNAKYLSIESDGEEQSRNKEAW